MAGLFLKWGNGYFEITDILVLFTEIISRNMSKKTDASKEVTEKESKKAKQTEDTKAENKATKKSLGKGVWKFLTDADKMQTLAAWGTLLFV